MSGGNAPPVVADFVARGVDDVVRAMLTIEQAITKSSTKAAATAARADNARVSSAKQSATAEGKAREAAYQAWARRVDAIKERSASYAGKLAAKEADAEIKAARKAADAIAGIRERSATMAGAYARKAAADQARATQALAREENRIRREMLRNQVTGRGVTSGPTSPPARLGMLQDARNRSPAEQRAAIEHVRNLRGDHVVYSSAHERESRENEHEQNERRQRYVDATFAGTTKGFRTMVNGGRAVTRHALTLGGGFDVDTALKERVELERDSIRFSNSAFQNRPGETRMDPKAIQEQARVNAIKYNTDAGELLAGSARYGEKSGDYEGGLKLQDTFAKIAKGTGASVADVAATAGILRVQNKNLGEKEMTQLLLNTIRQGQAGSVEFADLGKVAGNFTRSSSSYVGDQGKNQGILLGLGQKAMATAGRDPREAATVITNMASDVINHRADAEKLLGKEAFDKNGRIAMSPDEMIATAMQNSGGDLGKLGSVFKGRSIKMMQAVSPEFTKARDEALAEGKSTKEANKAGADAVRADLRPLVEASMTMTELEANVAEVMKSGAEQFEAATRELKMVVGQELVPVLKDLLPILKDCIPPLRDFLHSMTDVVTWAKSHPFEGAFAILTASITKEIVASIVKAEIGNVIKRALMGAGGGGPGGPGAGGLGGGPSGPGTGPGGGSKGGGLALGGALLSIGELAKLGDDVYAAGKEGEAQGAQVAEDLKSGDPKRVAAAQDAIKRAQANQTTRKRGEAYGNITGTALEWLYNPAGAIANQFGDWAKGKAGVKTDAERRTDTLRAGGLLSNPDVKREVADPGSVARGVVATEVKQGNAELVEALDRHAEKLEANTKATEANSKATGGADSPTPKPLYSPTGPIGNRATETE